MTSHGSFFRALCRVALMLTTLFFYMFFFVGALIDDLIEEDVYIEENDEATTRTNEYTTGIDLLIRER